MLWYGDSYLYVLTYLSSSDFFASHWCTASPMRLGLPATATPEDLKREQPGMEWATRNHGIGTAIMVQNVVHILHRKKTDTWNMGFFSGFHTRWVSMVFLFHVKSCGDLWNFQCLQPILHMIRRVPKVGFARSLERLLVTVCHGKSVWPGFSQEKVELQ